SVDQLAAAIEMVKEIEDVFFGRSAEFRLDSHTMRRNVAETRKDVAEMLGRSSDDFFLVDDRNLTRQVRFPSILRFVHRDALTVTGRERRSDALIISDRSVPPQAPASAPGSTPLPCRSDTRTSTAPRETAPSPRVG